MSGRVQAGPGEHSDNREQSAPGKHRDRPYTTLFLLMSVDGKISTGSTDELDVDSDFPLIPGLKEGLAQYYDIEQTTDLWSLVSGRVQAKLGANTKPLPAKTPVSFALIDSSHLTAEGVRYFCAKSRECVLITQNRTHPAFGLKEPNLHIILQETRLLSPALAALKAETGCQRLTLQTGGSLNGQLLREKLIDAVDIVVAPVLVGGKDTPTLIDGPSLACREELSKLGVLRLTDCRALKNSYLRLRYQVLPGFSL